MAFTNMFGRSENRQRIEKLEKRNKELEDYLYNNFEEVFSEFNESNEISVDDILKIPVAVQCIELISSSIAQMPVYLHKKNKDGTREEIEGDNRVKLLNVSPNKHNGAYQFKKQIVRDYLIYGGGYSSIEKSDDDGFGFIVDELYYLPKSNLNIRATKSSYKPVGATFEITSDGDGIQKGKVIDTLNENNVLRVLKDSKNFDAFQGIGVLKTGQDVFKRALDETKFIRNIYKRGAFPTGVLTTKARLSQVAIDRLRNAWASLYGGSDNNAKTVILEEGMDYKPLSHSPADIQLNEMRKNTMSEICILFGVPESLITTAANKYGSIEQNSLHFLKHTLAPIINAFEDGLNLSLLDETEQGEYFFEFDVEELSRATEKERVESFATAVDGSILTPNEVRQKLGFNKIPGADDLLMSLGKVAIDTKTGKPKVFNTGQGMEEKNNDKTTQQPNRT